MFNIFGRDLYTMKTLQFLFWDTFNNNCQLMLLLFTQTFDMISSNFLFCSWKTAIKNIAGTWMKLEGTKMKWTSKSKPLLKIWIKLSLQALIKARKENSSRSSLRTKNWKKYRYMVQWCERDNISKGYFIEIQPRLFSFFHRLWTNWPK